MIYNNKNKNNKPEEIIIMLHIVYQLPIEIINKY